MMETRVYEIVLTGQRALLMHKDDVDASDALAEFRKDMAKGERKAGDDRSPAWSWLTYLYNDGEHVVMDSANVMAALRYGGAKVSVGKGSKTFKEQSQSGIMPTAEQFEFRVLHNGRLQGVPMAPLLKLKSVKDFRDHCRAVEEYGFALYPKRASVGTSKHVRVRPRFPAGWQVRGQVAVTDDMLTDDVLKKIFDAAGRGGLCDWRPSGKTPGLYGIFTATLRRAS